MCPHFVEARGPGPPGPLPKSDPVDAIAFHWYIFIINELYGVGLA